MSAPPDYAALADELAQQMADCESETSEQYAAAVEAGDPLPPCRECERARILIAALRHAAQEREALVDPLVILRQVVEANGSQVETARALCISVAYLCDLLHGRRQVSEAVAESLGLERVVTYRDRRAQKARAVLAPTGGK